MNIDEIIDTIENRDTTTERCIGYCEVILYLQAIKATYIIIENPTNWKDEISAKLTKDMHTTLDKGINQCKDMIQANVEYNKNKLL